MQIPAEEAAFMEQKGEITRVSNRVFLGLRQEFLPSGFSDKEEKSLKRTSGLWCKRACQQTKCYQ